MTKNDIDMRDALAAAWAGARVACGQARSLGPAYADRAGLAYQVLRGRQLRSDRRMIALTAFVAGVAGMCAGAIAATVVAVRRTEAESAPQPEPAIAKATEAEP